MTKFLYKMTKSSVVDENSAVDKNLVVDEYSDEYESSVVNCRQKFCPAVQVFKRGSQIQPCLTIIS